MFNETSGALAIAYLFKINGFWNLKFVIDMLLKIYKYYKDSKTPLMIQTVKHIQYLWSGLGDLYVSLFECKFIKKGDENYIRTINMWGFDSNKDFFLVFYNQLLESLSSIDANEIDEISYFFNLCLHEIFKLAASSFKNNPILYDQKKKNPFWEDWPYNIFGMRDQLFWQLEMPVPPQI